MASALTALANATATFTVPTTGTITDPTTGNVTAATETVTVDLYLKRFGFLEKQVNLPGVEVLDETFQGYAVAPQALDARIRPGTIGTLAFSGEDPIACEVLVTRFDYGTTGLIGATIQAVLGDTIRFARYVKR